MSVIWDNHSVCHTQRFLLMTDGQFNLWNGWSPVSSGFPVINSLDDSKSSRSDLRLFCKIRWPFDWLGPRIGISGISMSGFSSAWRVMSPRTQFGINGYEDPPPDDYWARPDWRKFLDTMALSLATWLWKAWFSIPGCISTSTCPEWHRAEFTKIHFLESWHGDMHT